MREPDPQVNNFGREWCHREACRLRALAAKSIAPGDPLAGIAWAVLALEQRTEEAIYYYGDIADHTEYIG